VVSDITVRQAQRTDVRAGSQVLGRAFLDDPVMRWMLPDADLRRRKLHRLFDAVIRHRHLANGACEIASDGGQVVGAALWDPPGKWRHTRAEELRQMPPLLLAFGGALRKGLGAAELMKKAHPEQPHWYLAVIGSDPAVRGKGFGQALMRSRLDRCDAEYAPAYLESSNPDNVPYYERFGFEVTGELTLPGHGPSLWPMWRQPR
jgi:ribosomal protein S18 acetylase RimI-like enzyme